MHKIPGQAARFEVFVTHRRPTLEPCARTQFWRKVEKWKSNKPAGQPSARRHKDGLEF